MKTTVLFLTALAATLAFAADTSPKPYPLKTCIVSGEKLGSMGKPAVLVQDGQEIRFCCKNCIKDFKKEPQKYLKEIADAAGKK